ncbi:MAG: hypothetical protein IJA26_07805, partial [Clostridia bacterium]|nr:hypothetical protein [Clostridia bacterium]
MKRKILLLTLVCLLISAISLSACAYVSVYPNQELALRTGPNTKYVWMYHLPLDTQVVAYEQEMGNGVPWVLVEFMHDGKLVRGYTGLKRFNVYSNIPWADHIGSSAVIAESGTVWAAPGYNAAYRGRVDRGDSVTLLEKDWNFAYIEFYDDDRDAYSRGYVYADMIKTASSNSGSIPILPDYSSRGVPATPNQELALRTGPTTGYTWLFHLPEDTPITAYEYEQGSGVTWVLIEFEYKGMRCRGYTGLKRMDVHGNIPWADHLWEMNAANYSTNIYAAPSADAYYRGYLDRGTYVSILDY